MRIGQVTQDNYKDYLKMLGVKNPKNLDNLQEKSGKGETANWKNKDYSHEAMEARAVAAGRAVAGMVIDGNNDDGSWRKIVDVPDSFRQQCIESARKQIAMTAKTGGCSAEEYDKYVAENKDWSYFLSCPPEERLSVSWTGIKICQAELERMENYLKEKIPGWQSGQPFDIKVLTESNWGLDDKSLDVKA